jgi:hypothetical protein
MLPLSSGGGAQIGKFNVSASVKLYRAGAIQTDLVTCVRFGTPNCVWQTIRRNALPSAARRSKKTGLRHVRLNRTIIAQR